MQQVIASNEWLLGRLVASFLEIGKCIDVETREKERNHFEFV